MEPTSPKGFDLQRDSRFALHASVENSEGGGGEFFMTGQARIIQDDDTRRHAVQSASYDPADRYILFELPINSAFSNIYQDDGPPLRNRWKESV